MASTYSAKFDLGTQRSSSAGVTIGLIIEPWAINTAQRCIVMKWTINVVQKAVNKDLFKEVAYGISPLYLKVNGVGAGSIAISVLYWSQTDTFTDYFPLFYDANGNVDMDISVEVKNRNHRSDGAIIPNLTKSLHGSISGLNSFSSKCTYSSQSPSVSVSVPSSIPLGQYLELNVSGATVLKPAAFFYKFQDQIDSFPDWPVEYDRDLWWLPDQRIIDAADGRPTDFQILMVTFDKSHIPNVKTYNVHLTVSGDASARVTLFEVVQEGPVPDSWDMWLTNVSKARVSVEGSGSYGAVIGEYSVGIVNSTHSKSSSAVFGPFQKAGKIEFEGCVVDAYGKKSPYSKRSVTLVEYQLPAFDGWYLSRCMADGTESEDGTCGKGQLTWKEYDCNSHNTYTVLVKYRQAHTGSTWKTEILSCESGKPFVFGAAAFSTEISYEIVFTLQDQFGNASISAILPSAFVMLDFKAGGKGIAVGKVSEIENCFEIGPNWEFHAGNAVVDGSLTLAGNEIHPMLNQRMSGPNLEKFMTQAYSVWKLQKQSPVSLIIEPESTWSPTGKKEAFYGFIFFQGEVVTGTLPARIILISVLEEKMYVGYVNYSGSYQAFWQVYLPSDPYVYTPSDGVYYSKSGGMGMISFHSHSCLLSSSIGSLKGICSIPAAYRPKIPITGFVTNWRNDSCPYEAIPIVIAPTGTISAIASDKTAGTTVILDGCITYPLNPSRAA